jgi:hypothetical protein
MKCVAIVRKGGRMSVRKRKLPSGEIRWQVDYRDQGGKRRHKQFATKAEATRHETKVRGELVAGTHVADSASITVEAAGDLWLQRAETEGLEASTIRQISATSQASHRAADRCCEAVAPDKAGRRGVPRSARRDTLSRPGPRGADQPQGHFEGGAPSRLGCAQCRVRNRGEPVSPRRQEDRDPH